MKIENIVKRAICLLGVCAVAGLALTACKCTRCERPNKSEHPTAEHPGQSEHPKQAEHPK